MLYTVKEDLELCKEFKISPRQLMFVKMLVKDPGIEDKEWKKKSYAMSLEFQDRIKMSADELSDLIARDIIVDYNTVGSPIYYDCYEINEKFNHKFALKVYPMSSQLFDIYPKFGVIDSQRYSLRNASPEEIAPSYMKAIGKNPEEHDRIIDDVKWAVEKDCLKIGLKKFVDTKHWEAIRELRKTNTTNFVSDVKII